MSGPDPKLLNAIAHRHAAMAYAERPIPQETLRLVFEAARWAPSSFNEQPWRFVVATKDDAEAYERLASCLSRGNAWAREAPVLILALTKLELTRNGKPNNYCLHDLGLALQNLLIQATALGLASHPMGGFDKDAAAERLQVPEGYRPMTMVALGYPGDPDTLSEAHRDRELGPRQRHPLAEFVFAGQFGQPAKFALTSDDASTEAIGSQ